MSGEDGAGLPQPGQVGVLLPAYPSLHLRVTKAGLLAYDVDNLSAVGQPELNIVASGTPFTSC